MKTAIITGASSGMGREFVIQIADRFGGIDEIWVIARRMERLKELIPETPARLKLLGIDLKDEEDREKLARALEEAKPDVKLLVNSAGYGKIGPVGSVALEEETGIVEVNCEALCAVTHTVLPYMSNNSRIIQFASSAAFLPQPGFAIYAASKSFVLSYSRALHQELKPRGICVTAVCPGPVRTEFFDVAETTGRIPLYKALVMADPVKVVKKALADSMMGRTVSVYGGLMKVFCVLCKIFPHDLVLQVYTSLARVKPGKR